MKFKRQLTALAFAMAAGSSFAQLVVGVSYDAFQEERWKTDEAAIKAELAKSGAKYIMSDAGTSAEKQLSDIDGLIAKGAKVLIEAEATLIPVRVDYWDTSGTSHMRLLWRTPDSLKDEPLPASACWHETSGR